MPYHTVSHGTVLYLSVSYGIVSYHTLSYRIISYRIVSYLIVPYHIVSCHSVLYRTVSYCIASYHIVSWGSVSYCTTLMVKKYKTTYKIKVLIIVLLDNCKLSNNTEILDHSVGQTNRHCHLYSHTVSKAKKEPLHKSCNKKEKLPSLDL